jgi:hypothetical protein
MKKSCLTVVLTLASLLGFGISAHAQEAGRVSVTIAFEFVAGGRTLPPGTYSIGRGSSDPRSGLIISTYGNSVLLLPRAVDEASTGQPKLSFEHVGDEYILSKIETPVGVYTIETPRAIAKLARNKDRGAVSSFGN